MKKQLFLLVVTGCVLINSCTEVLFEPDIAQEKIEIVAPGADAQLTDFDVSFFWENNPNVTSYRLQVATPNFTTPQKVVLDTLLTTHGFDFVLPENDYQWRIRAENSAYQGAYATQFFSVINNNDFYKNAVILLSPVDNSISKDTTQVFTWQPVTGAVAYGFQIIDNNNMVLIDSKVTEPQFTYDFKQGTYTWKVRADNDIVTTGYSARTISIDTTTTAATTSNKMN